MLIFTVPENREVVEAIGLVAVRHAQLDYCLRLMIKSLGGVTVNQALDATSRVGSGELRERIRKLGRKRLGEGNALIKLEATLKECERLTSQRNDLMHNIVGKDVDSQAPPMMRDDNHQWKPLPSVDELRGLEKALGELASKLNDERLHGYLKDAINNRPVV